MILKYVKFILDVFLFFWWLWLPMLAWSSFWDKWSNYVWDVWKSKLDWIILKIQVPKEVEQSPKIVEQVLAVIHGTQGSGSSIEKLVQGRIPDWASLEIETKGGIVSFYVRVLRKYKGLVESAFYGQYPDIIITEEDDYTKDVPDDIINSDYDIWGTNFRLVRPDAYPIRTYPEFKEEFLNPQSDSNVNWVDPMSSMMEVLSNVQPTDRVWIQLIIRPASDREWKPEAEEVRDKLIGRLKDPAKESFIERIWKHFKGFWEQTIPKIGHDFVSDTPLESDWSFLEENGSDEKGPNRLESGDVTPGESETIQAIERSLGKIGFHTIYRFIYIGKKDAPNASVGQAVQGAIRQFHSQNLNEFCPDFQSWTKVDYPPFKNLRLKFRKLELIKEYKTRDFTYDVDESYRLGVLNIEELATLFHFPATFVQTPKVERATTRRGSAPLDLPIVENHNDEEENK